MHARGMDCGPALSARGPLLMRRSTSEIAPRSSYASERFSSTMALPITSNHLGGGGGGSSGSIAITTGSSIASDYSQRGQSLYCSKRQARELVPSPRSCVLSARLPMSGISRTSPLFSPRNGQLRRVNGYEGCGPVQSSEYMLSVASHRLPKAGSATGEFFIPPARSADEGKLVVVLDLDETLVYSRNGPIILRPGTTRLLDVLQGRCEVVVWTAGERLYAMEVIQKVDPNHCIQHCVYRDRKWWTERPGYVKDVNELGRPLDRTIIIDNTPDCLRSNPRNGLLVTDFRGKRGPQAKPDTTLFVLAEIIDDILRGPVASVEAFHNHPRLQLRQVQCDSGGSVEVLTLKQDSFANAPRIHFLLPYRK